MVRWTMRQPWAIGDESHRLLSLLSLDTVNLLLSVNSSWDAVGWVSVCSRACHRSLFRFSEQCLLTGKCYILNYIISSYRLTQRAPLNSLKWLIDRGGRDNTNYSPKYFHTEKEIRRARVRRREIESDRDPNKYDPLGLRHNIGPCLTHEL